MDSFASSVSLEGRIITSSLTGISYLLESQIGEGGFGAVYSGVSQGEVEKQVAIKLLINSYSESFANENLANEILVWQLWSSQSQLADSYAIALRDICTGTPGIYLVMDMVDGDDLYKAVGTNPSDELAFHLIRGIDYFHRLGISHCDLRPNNIMYNNGRPRLIDFGFQRINATLSQRLLGSFAEEIRGNLSNILSQFREPELTPAEMSWQEYLVSMPSIYGEPDGPYTSPDLSNLLNLASYYVEEAAEVGDEEESGRAIVEWVKKYDIPRAHDIWALGCILFQIYTPGINAGQMVPEGMEPLTGPPRGGIFDYVSIAHVIRKVPNELIRSLLAKMLVNEPQTRIANWKEVMKSVPPADNTYTYSGQTSKPGFVDLKGVFHELTATTIGNLNNLYQTP